MFDCSNSKCITQATIKQIINISTTLPTMKNHNLSQFVLSFFFLCPSVSLVLCLSVSLSHTLSLLSLSISLSFSLSRSFSQSLHSHTFLSLSFSLCFIGRKEKYGIIIQRKKHVSEKIVLLVLKPDVFFSYVGEFKYII